MENTAVCPTSPLCVSTACSTFLYRVLLWVIVCVCLAGPWCAQVFGQVVFQVLLGGCFWKRLTSKSVLKGKPMVFSSVGGPHLISGWTARPTKPLTLPQVRGNSSCLSLNWAVGFFLLLDSSSNAGSSWVCIHWLLG